MQRAAIWWFGALLLAAIPAFWPGYFGAPPFRDDFLHVHLHGVARTLLALFSLAVGPTFFLPQTAAWRSFTEAFARLPLP